MKKRVIGIDESNHGQDPEIYVATLANSEEDLKIKRAIRKKPDKRSELKDISLLHKEHDYRYIHIPRSYEGCFENEGIRAIVISEFITFFKNKIGSLDETLMDGAVSNELILRIYKILYQKENTSPNEIPQITGRIKGDSKTPLLNISHHLAYHLFKHHTSRRSQKRRKEYMENIISPKFEDYYDIFKENNWI